MPNKRYKKSSKSWLKRNAFLVNENKEIVDEVPNLIENKKTRIELKHKTKILRNEFINNIEKEGRGLPEERRNTKRTKMPHQKELEAFEENHFTRRRITKKEKKGFNLKGNQDKDEFNDFTELNDIKGIFGKKEERRGKKINKGKKY